jgi:DNA-binding SARP family transcriptional activator/ABC-type branched-subunit amino acid transport system substrate-binding protein
MGRIEFDVLGPLAVRRDGRPVPLGGGKRALLLALFLIEPGRPVARQRLIDELWGEQPPETAVTALQGLVSQLRRLLEDEDAVRDGSWKVLVGRGSGYGVSPADGTIDAHRFFAHMEQARDARDRGDHAGALAATDAALALWRGLPLLGLSSPDIDAFAERCERARLDVLEDRADALLGLGRPREALAEVEPLIEGHPLRERLRAAQVVALYRCGRQVDALAALASARNRLRNELGLEPSPMLDELERRILNHDPALGPAGPPADAPRRGGSRVRIAVAALTAIAVVAAGAVAFSTWRDDGAPTAAGISAGDQAVAIEAASGKAQASYAVGAGAVGLTSDDDAVWTLNADDSTVTRIDLEKRSTRTFGTGTTPVDLAAGDGALWVADGSRTRAQFVGPVVSAVSKLDPANGSVVVTTGLEHSRTLTSNTARQQIVATPEAIFVVGSDFAISRLDPATGNITARSSDVRAIALASGRLGLWALEPTGLAHLDPATLRLLDRVPLASTNLSRLAVGVQSVWVTDSAAGTLWRVDPAGVRGAARTIALEPGIDAVAVGSGSVWVASPEGHQLIRIDPDRNEIAERIPLSGPPLGVIVAGRLIWVTVGAQVAPAGDLLGRSCGPVIYGGGGLPDSIIVSDLPMGAGPRIPARQMADAIAFVLRAHHYRAGGRTVGYRACDHWSGATAVFDPAKCRANGRAYARSKSVLAVIGPFNSGCALALIPPTNAAPGGPLPVISPTTTSTDLTRKGLTTPAGLPGSLYPAGTRSFARLMPTEDQQGVALAREAKALGARRIVVVTGGAFGETIRRPFEAASLRLGLQIMGSYVFDPTASGYASLARRVERDRPDAVLVAGLLDENAGAVIRDLRQRLGRRVALIGSDGLLPISVLFARAGAAARDVHIAFPGLDPRHLGPAGRAFVRAFGASRQGSVDQAAVYAAAAAELALDAIAHSNGTRGSVLAALRRQRLAGILGTARLDAGGDVRPATFTIVRANRPGGSDTVASVDGAVWERVLSG